MVQANNKAFLVASWAAFWSSLDRSLCRHSYHLWQRDLHVCKIRSALASLVALLAKYCIQPYFYTLAV